MEKGRQDLPARPSWQAPDGRVSASTRRRSKTVRVHIKNIYAKLGVGDRTEAMSVAIRRGIVHID